MIICSKCPELIQFTCLFPKLVCSCAAKSFFFFLTGRSGAPGQVVYLSMSEDGVGGLSG